MKSIAVGRVHIHDGTFPPHACFILFQIGMAVPASVFESTMPHTSGKSRPQDVPLETSVWTQRLPFGLYMKRCRAPRNEAHVLKLVENYTTIPAPRLTDTWEHNGVSNLLMTRVCGVRVGDVCHRMSYAERDRFADNMRDCIAQLRRIPNTTPYLSCDALGNGIVDHRIPDGGRGGPFKTEADFNNHLASHLGGSYAKVAEWREFTPREHSKFYFTHSDLHPTNLLVENGRLSAIVDWESAGFRPEYWEFTKAMYVGQWPGESWGDDLYMVAHNRPRI